MFQGGVVGENNDMGTYKVGPKLFESKNYRQKLIFSYDVIHLCIIQG